MTSQPAGGLLVVGLTGPIGCGKSTVAGMLTELGAEVIDADTASRTVTEPGAPALPEIRERFGAEVFRPDGALDRAALATVVFADPAALADLERITHPRVREVIDQRLAQAGDLDPPLAVIEAIKLVEGGLADRCAAVWLVECSPETQHERLKRRGATDDDIRARVAAQGEGLVDRLARALDGRVPYRRLSTDGTLDETRERVEDALAEVLAT
jgi:dephospho-CoA kinase